MSGTIQKYNTFDGIGLTAGATAGNTIVSGNTGGWSGTPFEFEVSNSGLTWSQALPHSRGMASWVCTTAAWAYQGWNLAAPTGTVYVRLYWYPTAISSTSTGNGPSLFKLREGTGGTSTGAISIRHTPAGSLIVEDSAGATKATASPGPTLNAWNRIELKAVKSSASTNAVGNTFNLRLYAGANADGTTPDYDSGVITGNTFGTVGTTLGCLWLGPSSNLTNQALMYFDNFAYALDDWVGPVKTKYWTGSVWKVTKKTRGYTGAAFRPLKIYDGSAWVDPTR